MALITVQVLEGHERGQVFSAVPTPLTIGREDDNRIRLNDERVSRFHAKIQEDGGRIILTDLDSTNGTRVNGQPVQMRVLQAGDQLSIGRCLLVYGSPEEIAAKIRDHAELDANSAEENDGTYFAPDPDPMNDFAEDGFTPRNPFGTALFPQGMPGLPEQLRPAQQAELSDLIAYVHDQIQNVIHSAVELPSDTPDDAVSRNPKQGEGMYLSWLGWQRLLVLESGLAQALRRVADPSS